MRTPLARFVVKVLAWLPPAFALWYFAGPLLVLPARLLIAAIAGSAWPGIVDDVGQSASTIVFSTLLRPGQSSGQSASIVVEVNALLYAFGMPMYAALTIAARDAHWIRKLAIGYACLVPVIVFGATADFLKNIAITSGPLVASQTGFTAWQREVIAFAFQSGALILPTVVPAIAWVLLHRRFVETLRGTPSS